MSTTNNSINNTIGSVSTNTILNQLRAASGQWQQYFDQTDAHGYYSGSGSPEGVVAADIGSIYSDTGAGASGVYYKATDTVNTGWVLLAPTSTAVNFYVTQNANTTANTTGGAAVYTFGNLSSATWTTVQDTGGNISFPASVLTFTAPATGMYLLGGGCTGYNIVAHTSSNLILVTSGGRIVNLSRMGAANSISAAAQLLNEGTVIIPLTVGETAIFRCQYTGSTDTVGFIGTVFGAGDVTYFYGTRVS